MIGLVVVAVGLFLLLDVLGVFPGSAARMHAPRWVALVVASLFTLCGAYVLLIAVVGEAMARAFGEIVGIAIFVGLSAVAHWVAFGTGDRGACSGGVSAMGIGFSTRAPDFECRAAFGYGALLMDFILLRGVAWQIAQRAPGSRAVRVLEKISEWGMGLLLLPLILLVILFRRDKESWGRIVSWFRSKTAPGKPPPPA